MNIGEQRQELYSLNEGMEKTIFLCKIGIK